MFRYAEKIDGWVFVWVLSLVCILFVATECLK